MKKLVYQRPLAVGLCGNADLRAQGQSCIDGSGDLLLCWDGAGAGTLCDLGNVADSACEDGMFAKSSCDQGQDATACVAGYNGG